MRKLIQKTNDLIKLNVNDKISLTGLYNTSKNLRVDNLFFEFTDDSYFVKINYPHTLKPQAGEISEVKWHNANEIPHDQMAFDHGDIVQQLINRFKRD